MPDSLPQTAPLIPAPGAPVWVRVFIAVSTPFSLQLNGTAVWLARDLYENLAADPAVPVFPIAPPTVTGGSIVMDFRVRTSTTPGQLAQTIERFKPAVSYDVVRVEELRRGELASDVAPAQRESAALEAEETARPARTTIGDALGTVRDAAVFIRGLIVTGIVAAVLVVGWPFLRQASASGASLLKARQRRQRRKGGRR